MSFNYAVRDASRPADAWASYGIDVSLPLDGACALAGEFRW